MAARTVGSHQLAGLETDGTVEVKGASLWTEAVAATKQVNVSDEGWRGRSIIGPAPSVVGPRLHRRATLLSPKEGEGT